MKVLFITGFSPIVSDDDKSKRLYVDSLELPLKQESDGYLHSEALEGAKTFGLWPLSQAAESCFGTSSWPKDLPVPQASLEIEVDNVETATRELESKGVRILVRNKKEPWGQTVSRFISPEGLLLGLTFTPMMRAAK